MKPHVSQSEKDIIKENYILKRQVEALEKANNVLRIKIEQKDQNYELDVEPKLSNDTKEITKHSCEKCCLPFPCMDKLRKHKSEMQKVTLTF